MKKFNKFMSEAKGYGDVNRAVGSAQDKLDRAQAKNVTSKGKKLGVLADPYSGKPTKQEVWEYKGKKWLVLGKSVEVFVPMKYHKVIKENFVLRDGEYLKKGTPVKWKAADGKEVEGKIEGHQSGRYIDEILVTKSKSKFYKPGDYAYDVYASDIGVTFKEDIEQIDEVTKTEADEIKTKLDALKRKGFNVFHHNFSKRNLSSTVNTRNIKSGIAEIDKFIKSYKAKHIKTETAKDLEARGEDKPHRVEFAKTYKSASGIIIKVTKEYSTVEMDVSAVVNLSEDIEQIDEAGEWIDAWAQAQFLQYGIAVSTIILAFGILAAQYGVGKARQFFKDLKKSKNPKADVDAIIKKQKIKEDIEQVDEGFKQLKNIKNTHPEMVRFDQMKWYRKLVKQLKDEPGEEIVLTIEKPSDSYRKTSGFGDSVSVRQQDISGIGLGKTKTEKLGGGGIRTTKVLAINENVRQIDELFGLGKKKDKQHKYKAGDELPELGGTIRFKSKKFPGFTLEGSPFTRLSGKRYEVSIKDVVNFKDRSKLGLQKYNKAIGNVEVVSAKDIIEIVKYNQFGKYATKKTPQEKDRFDRNDYGININDIKKGQYVEYSDKGKSSKHSIIGKVTGIGDDELVYVEVYKSTDPRIKPGSGRKMVYFGWIKRILDRSAVTEDIANAAGGPLGSNPSTGTIAGYDPMLKKKPLKRSKFAGTECFEVDNDTFQKCHTGHGKHERWDRYLKDDCDSCKTIRAYAKRYPQKDIVIQRAGCGTMTWLKKKGVHY